MLAMRYTGGTRQNALSEHQRIQSVRLVGAVGIENNAEQNFKELAETVRNAETLKRNNQERKGILIGP